MKVLIILCALIVFASSETLRLTQEQTEGFSEYYNECVKSSGVNRQLIVKVANGESVDDDYVDAFFHCIFTKTGFMTNEGVFQEQVIRQKLPIEKKDLDKLFTACGRVGTQPKRKIATAAYSCYVRESPVKVRLYQ